MAKAKKSKARKSKAAAKKPAPKKAAPKKPAPKKAVKKKKPQMIGEGDYAASRAFLKDQSAFVKRNKAKIPGLARKAQQDLDSPAGDALRAAEEKARSRAAD